mgnify:FL=1
MNDMVSKNRSIGNSVIRADILEKVTGKALYTADLKFSDLLHARIVRSPHPHANIISVDLSCAWNLSGVVDVLTPFNVPEGKVAPDLPILDTRVRFVGDEVAVVVAENELVAKEAINTIDVEYQILDFSVDIHQALSSGAIPIHAGGNLINGSALVESRGDVEQGFAKADIVLEESFTTPDHHPAALEPRAATAFWDGKLLRVYKTSRGIHADRSAISSALGLRLEQVEVIAPYLGGGFGSKDETRLAVLASVASMRSQKPVKIELDREEEFLAGRRRHSTQTKAKIGITHSGDITGIDVETIMDTGAYLSSGPGVVRRAGQAALYLYECPNVRYKGSLVYTNTPAAGSYRALGAPQGHFALESLIDRAANAIEMDPLDFRLKNHVSPKGQQGERVTPIGNIVDTQPVEGGIPFSSNCLRECLMTGSKMINWYDREKYEYSTKKGAKIGVGMSMFVYRGGPGGKSSAVIDALDDGNYAVSLGVMDVGEGALTVLSQIAADSLGIGIDSIQMVVGNTSLTPKAPITAGSTVTFSTGKAIISAAHTLREQMTLKAAAYLRVPASDLKLDGTRFFCGKKTVSVRDLVLDNGGKISVSKTIEPGSTEHVINSFGAHFVKLRVDETIGSVEILKYVAVHDSGTIINPTLAQGQVRGGISQMLGYTFTEDMIIDKSTGIVLNANYLDHKSPTVRDIPKIDVVFVGENDPDGPYGAKSLGEPPSIGPAPAIANALYNATGKTYPNLPITLDRIIEGS